MTRGDDPAFPQIHPNGAVRPGCTKRELFTWGFACYMLSDKKKLTKKDMEAAGYYTEMLIEELNK